MNNLSKVEIYNELVKSRKSCDACKECGLTNPSAERIRKFDSEQIGPWTRWNGDLNAQILIVGQEWGSITTFIKQKGLDRADSPTNEMLVYLLASVGVDLKKAPNYFEDSGVFLTNAALCLKEGTDSSAVREQWFKNCGERYLAKQVDLVQPQIVVAIGKQAYRGICYAYDMEPISKFSDVVGTILPIKGRSKIRMIPVPHLSPLTKAFGGQTLSRQFRNWTLVKTALEHK